MEYLDNRKSFFEAVSKKVNIGSYDEFLKKIESPDNRKNLFDALSESYNIGTFEEYESKLGFSNQDTLKQDTPIQATPNQKSYVSGGEQAFTQSDEALRQDKPANKFAELFRNPHQENYFKDISDREAREKEKISYVIDPYQDDDLTQFTPKKEQTYQDIMINQSELFKATPKGQEAYSKLMEKQTSVLGKYIDKYKNTPEYRRHVENYQKEYSTAVGDEQKATIDKKYNALLEERLHSLYGTEMNTELEPAMGEYLNALYETRQTSIDGATQRLGRTYTQAKLPEIKQSINDALSEHQNSPEYKKARDKEFKRQEIAAMFKPELAHTTFATTELNLSLNPVMRQLNAAKKRIEKSEDMIEAALQGKGLGAGFIDQAKRINNWTYGFNDFIENSDVRQVIEKAEKDENSLTKSEKALLDAVALEACAIQYFSYQLSRGYKAGTTTAASVPFMIEFMVNPLSGAGRALAKTLGGWAIKRGITGFGLKSLTFGSRMLGDMLGAAGMTATSSIGRVASGVEERMIGNVGSYADVEGVHFAGREGEQTFGEAVRNSVADNLVENYSEMFFGAFEGGSKAIRGFLKSSPLKGLPKTKVFEIAKNLFSSYDKFQRAVQFHGYLGEVSEEYIGNLLRLGVTTDTEASDVFNEDAQIDTWLGLLPTSAAFGIIGVSGRGINKYSRYKDTHRMNYEKFKASLSSQELASFENVEAHINAGDTEFTKDYIKETLHNKELNDAQKIERLNAVYGAMYDKNYDDFREVEIASIEERLHNNHYNKNTNGIMTVATDKKSGNIVFVTGAADNGELIVEGIDGKQETVPADRLEDMKSVDYYSTLKSIAEGEFARRRVERLYKEGDEVQDKDGNNFTVSQLSDNGVIIKNSEGEEAEVPFMYFDDNFTSKAEVDIDKADAEIDKQTNSTNGRVTNVKIGGKEGVFYIKAGNLVAYKDDNDNVIIDKEHSDETFVVVDAETGEAKQVGINQIDEVLGDAAPIELKEQSHDEIRNAAENKNTFPVGALVYNEEMPNVFTTVIDNGGYGFSIATVNEKTGRLENVPISNDAKEGWKTLNLSEGNVLQTNLSKFEIISNEGNGNLIVSIDGGEAVRMGTAELSERLQYEGFNLSSYIENESKKAEQKEQTPEQLQEEEDDQYSDADLYATVKALYKKREKQEKIANNPIDLTDQKAIKARETAKKNVELLTEELAKWQAIINKRDERKKAEREKQNAISEERRAAIEAERIKQKELERIEREKAQGVPDVSVDNAEDARKRGYRIETGRMVERQQPQYGLIGNEREVVFSSKDKVTGKYKVVEAETLQESHINGKRNTKFFLTEAQPKERTDKASQMAAQKIAENLNPKQITEGTTAYVGTPITNTRGEIIQGNNRTSALKYMYSQVPEKSAEYKQFLIDNADSFGLNSEEIAAMKNPVLVTEIDVTDEEAIRLGQKNAQDTESGGIQRIDSEKTAKSLGDGLYQFTSRLMQSNDEEQSLSSTIEQNGRDALKILLSKNLINETQYQSAFNNKGELTPEAKEDLAGIVESIVFANSKNDNIKTMFNSLPQAAKKAILQTVARDAFNSEDVKVVPYIQEAIEIYYSLSLDTVFASAKTIEDVRKAAWSWSIQSQTDFVGNLFFPSQKYTNFALELAVMFKSQTMATQRAKFNELYDKLQGVGGDMFSETELLPFRDAVEKIYNVKLNKELGHVTNDGSHVLEVGSELGEERERGGTRGTRGDEQATSGARSADNREGVAGDNRQGTSNRQTKEEKDEKRAIAEGVTKKLNIDIEFVENPDELPDSEIKARRAIQEGEKVGGWYNPKTNKAYLYIPNVTTANEVEKTILHEVVAHKGLRGLLGKEQFNALCDSVWQQMTGKERLYWTEYVLGVKTGQAHPLDIARAIGSQANRRAAADEFMANMAENGIENKTAWQKIVEFVKDALRKMGFGKAFTDRELIEKDIKKLLSKSYKRQTRNKENSITNEKESDVRFRFVDNTEYIKDDLEEEKNKYGGKRYKIVGDDIIVSTYFVVENSDQYSEIRYASASFDKALDYAKDYYDNDIDSDYVTIDLESIERAIPISEFKENNEEIWGNSFNEFEGSLENYIDTYIDDYLDNAGVDVGYETDEEPVRFVIQKGERDNKYTDKLIWDVEDEIERRFGVKVGKYSSFYVNREGNITDAYEDEQGRENLSVTMRISDHTHNPANGKDDLNVLIADKDATSRRFFTSTEDLVFNSDYTADEIVDEIEEYWRNYARDNYNGDELDIRFRTTAYHGSPHEVDKFSTDYIGTGEGSQAFGWGLYFTSIKDIAKEYATMRKGGVGKNLPVIDNINRALKERGIKEYDKYSLIDFADALIENEGDFQKTLNQLEKWAKHDNTGELQELFDDISLLDAEVGNNLLGEANLYSVTIHKDKTPDQYTWLEWDKPVTERQKEAVRRVFDEITNNEPDYHKASELSNQFAKYDFEGKTGEDIYREISDALWSDKYKPKGDSDKRASLLLLKNGIDGIKYPAESIARGTTSDNARGFNYVVFDENAVSIDEHIRFRIGNKRKADMKAGLLNKLTNATEEQVERTISEIEKLGEDVKAGGDSKTEKVAYHWALKGTVILPEDNDKILQAIKVAEISKVNPMEYNSPMELINNHDHIKLKEKPIDPDTVHTLTNKKDLGNGITIYNVEESEDSRENMRKIINTHLGNKRSPWCLLQGDENGNLTKQSAKYWKYYNGIPKRVAFYEGRLIAFSANDSNNVVWWDKQDKPTKGIPITHKIPNDELERTGTTEYNEETGLYGEYSNIHRGNKENGLYEKWYDNGQLALRATYKDGKRNGLYEEWHDNGQMFMRATLLDDYINGLYERWYYNGQMFMRGTFKDDGKRDGLYEEWYDNGQMYMRAIYKDGERKLLPTDVSLQELVDRGELDKKYLYDENEGEGVLFRRENANKQSSESKTLEEYKSKFENPKDIITFALEENTISYGSKQKANETLRETVRNITETGKLRDDSGRKYILHDNNAQSGSKEPDSVIKKVTKRTVLKDFKESGFVEFAGTKIESPQDIADLFSIHRSPNIEKFHLIFVDDKGVILGTHAYTINLSNQALLPNQDVISDTYRKYNASGVYFLHNHPSGNQKVSIQDVASTDFMYKKLAEEGQNLIGHVVIDTDKFSYINISEKAYKGENYNQSLLSNYINEQVEEYEYKNAQAKLFSEREFIGSGKEAPKRLLEISKALLTANSSKGAIVYLTANLDIAAYDVFPDSAKESDIIKIAEQGYKNNLGSRIAFVHDGSYSFPLRMPHFTLDVIDIHRGSMEFVTENRETPTINQLWESQSEYRKGSKELEAIAKEIQSLKDKAIADGTFMKAPNGNPTNLNERQWLQVRTKAFKDWFGDWENAVKPYREVFQERHIAFQDLKDNGLRSAKFNSSDGSITVYHGTSKDIEGKIFDNGFNDSTYFSINKNGTTNGDSPLDVAKRKFGKDATVMEIKIDPRDIELAAGGSELYSPYRLVKGEDGVYSKEVNASKVVDENGEPLVVYHGGGANIIAFDYDKIGMQGRSEGAGFEFTENIELAKNYAKNHGGGLYSVFLNIKNPIKDVNQKTLSRAQKVKLLTKFNEKVNANEAYTSDLGKDVIFSDYTETQNIPKAIIEIVNMLVDDTDLDFINEFINTTHMNKEILEAFKEVTGYDGVILDKTDEWTKNGLYVVFTNTQIKSAIDNVGTFDSENEDIRFRTTAYHGSPHQDEHIRFRIGNKRKADMKAGLLNKLTNATEEQVERTISEIEKLGENVKVGGDSKTEKVAYHWALKGTVILPEDNDKILQAIKVSEISKANPMEYNSPMELINKHDHIELKEKPIDPDTVPTLTGKQDLGNGITVYNVDESQDSRENMRKIINTHWGKKRSPWCLLQGDEKGELTEQSAEYWEHYNAIPKRVAFYEGRLLAFSANDSNDVVWWDKEDEAHEGIPITHKIPNDELGRTGTTEYDENTGGFGEYSNIYKGNRENGLYEEWHYNGQLATRGNYKEGKIDGSFEQWYENGKTSWRATYKDGKMNGLHEYWYENGQLAARATYKDGKLDGSFERWHENGQMRSRSTYKDDNIDGTYEEWYDNGQMYMRATHKDGKIDGLFEVWYDNGKLKKRTTYKDGKRDGLYEEWYYNGQIETRAIYKDGVRKPLPTDVSLQELVDRGELDKKYLYDENDEENDIRFQKIPEPATPSSITDAIKPDESIIEYAKRQQAMFDGYSEERQQQIRDAVSDNMEKGGRLINRIYKNAFDANQPLERLQKNIQKQGGMVVNGVSDAYNDHFRSLGRATTAYDEFHSGVFSKFKNHLHSLSKKQLPTNIRWADKKNMTQIDKITLYLRAKDMVEAKSLGLPNRGEEGFAENVRRDNSYMTKVTPEEYVEEFERAVGTEDINLLWENVQEVNQWTLNYMEKNNFTDESIKEKYNRKYYVPQRGFEEGEAVSQRTRGRESNSNFNPALRKAKGRKSLSESPLAHMAQIAQSTIMQVEKNNTKRQFLNFCIANMRLGRVTGEFSVDKVYYKKTGRILENGLPEYEEVYGIIPYKELEQDAENRRELRRVKAELAKEGLRESERALLEKRAKQLSDAIIYEANVRLDQIRPQTKDNLEEHRVEVLYKGKRYSIFVNDVEVANALNRKDGEMGKWMKFFSTNLPFVPMITKYFSRILTQQNPSFALWNLLRDTGMGYMTNIVEHPNWVATFTENLIRTQSTIADYAFRGKLSEGEMGDYLKEFFAEGAQTGFSFINRMEDLKRQIKRELNVDNKLADKILKGGTSVLQFFSNITEWSELTVRFSQYVTAREHGMTPAQAATEAKEVSVNFDRKGKLRLFYGLFSFFNATMQGSNKMIRQWNNGHKIGLALYFSAHVASGVLNTLLMPDDPEDEKGYGEYDRMINIVIGSWRIPLPQGLRAFHAIGVQIALAMQGQKTLQAAIMDALSFVFGEWLPINPIDGFYIDPSTNRLRYRADLGFRSFVPTFATPIYDVVTNTTYSGGTVHREPFVKTLDVPATMLSKKGVNGTLQELTDKLFELGGGNLTRKTMMRSDGTRVSELYNWNPSDIEFLTKAFTGGVGQFAMDMFDTGYNIVTGNVNSFDDFAATMPVVKRAYKPYKEETSFNSAYYELLGKIKAAKESYNTLPKERRQIFDRAVSVMSSVDVNNPTKANLKSINNVLEDWNINYW